MVLDHKLKWDIWTDRLNTKSQQRLFFLRKLLSFNVSSSVLQTFYYAFVESVLSFGIICWFGNATEVQKKYIRKIITTSSKLSGIPLPSMESVYKNRILRKANSIVGNQRHPLAPSFELLPSGRRYCAPLFTKNRSKFSFVPQAIKLLNISNS